MACTFDSLFVVVVNWNGGSDENVRCIDSILGQGVPGERIVFVDNGSKDGSLEATVTRFPGLIVIANDGNLGFGEGANQGARAALSRGAQAVAFVNNDLRFGSDARVLEGLARALDADPTLGLIGPRVLFDDDSGRVWCAGGRLDFRQNLSTLLGNGSPDGPEWQVERDVDYIAGCALVARRQTLEEVGLFDAGYFAYMEDVELGLRARSAGWGVRTFGQWAALHAPSSATGGGYGARRKWMQALNSVRFLKSHGGAREWLRFALFDVATLPALLVVKSLKGEGRAALAKAKGIADGLRGRSVSAEALEPGSSRLWR